MYRGFRWVSTALCSFEYNIKETKFVAVPYWFDPQLNRQGNGMTLCNFKNKAEEPILIPSHLEGNPIPSATLFVKWTDTRVVNWLDEATSSFDYVIEGPGQLSRNIFIHMVLPSGAIFQGSTSVPPATSFNPRRTRIMFSEWQETYSLYSTKDLRVVRGENTGEERKNYLYITGIYSIPKKKFQKQIKLFILALISGAMFGAILGVGLADVGKVLGLWTPVLATSVSVFVVIVAVILIRKWWIE